LIAAARLLPLLLALLLAAPAHATTVLLLANDAAEGVGVAEGELVATGVFTDADITPLIGDGTPLLADLTPHDVVLLWTGPESAWADADALGDVLADYIDGGGEVVLAPFGLAPGQAPAGRFDTDGYSPVGAPTTDPVAGDVDFASPDTDTGHPALSGLSDVAFPDALQGDLPLSPAGELVAVDTLGALVVASLCDRSVLVANLYPPSLTPAPPAVTAEAALLLAQVIEATQLNAAPVASAGGPYEVVEGGSVGLDAGASTPGDLGPLGYAWDLDADGAFDDATGATTPFDASTLDGPTSATVEVRVTDACGRTSDASATVTVSNADPSIDSSGDDGPVDEGQAITFSAAASDVAGDPVSYSWDPGDGSPALTGTPASHTYADSGSYPVTLTVSDGDGGEAEETLTAVISNVAPTIDSLVGDGGGPVGATLAFEGVASDPGGAEDPLTWTWTWDDGSPAEVGVDLTDASHSWAVPGSYTVEVEVADDDGKETSQSLTVVISNPGPTLELVSEPASLDEAATGSWTVEASDVLGDPVGLVWSWGDSTPNSSGAGLETATHAYADDGAYTIAVVATDAFGVTASLELTVSVDNVDPSFVGSPPGVATEGVEYVAALSATDVPADVPDLQITPIQSPAGALWEPSTSTFTWSPTLPEALGGAATFVALVADGDGGTDALTWQVVASFADGDGDGMADSWEEDHGLDPDLDDSAGDGDADGLSNLDEWLGGTDPEVFDGPSAPVPLSPIGGEAVGTASPTLEVDNAIDPGGDTLTYNLQVFADEALLTPLASVAQHPEGSGTTSWTVDVTLAENTSVWWRARAADALSFGPWSAATSFFVDVANDPPTVPTPLSPIDQTVEVGVPPIVASAVTDPEDDPISVEIELVDDAGDTVAVLLAVEQPDGTWRAVPDPPLAQDVTYTWTARALDDRGGDSGPSVEATFHVDLSNTAPPSPVLVGPADGSEIATATPQLEVTVGQDVDGDPLTVVFAVDVGPDFASDLRQDLGPVEPSDGDAGVMVADALPENGVAWARARSEDDRGGASEWLVWSFLVDAVDEAPEPVRIVAPGEDEVVDGDGVEVRWAPTTDPEGDPLTYTLQVRSLADDAEAWLVQGQLIEDAAAEGSVSVDVELAPGAWLVRARASDDTGQTGDWGPDNRFVVLPPPGEEADLSGGEGPYGCDCAGSSVAGATRGVGAAWCLLGLVALRSARRRRRESVR